MNIFSNPQTGGEFFFNKILNYVLARQDVEVILPNEPDLCFLNLPKNALKINLYFMWRFMRLPRKTTILQGGVFYYNFFIANWLVRSIRRDIKIVSVFQQMPDPLINDPWSMKVRDFILGAYAHSLHLISVNSRYLANDFTEMFKIRPEKFKTVFPVGMNMAAGPVKLQKKQNRITNILCVAHIRKLKGQEYLIRALKTIDNIDYRCFLVGGTKEPDYEQELIGLIKKLGLSERVVMCGRLEGRVLEEMYKKADIFVLPSLYESYGTVIQEAMSFGLPVIASNVGGIPEQITNGRDGLLVEPADFDILAAALQKLITDVELRNKVAVEAFKKVEKIPTLEDVCELFFSSLISA
jgi:glycosyltransferase involved in cell wall biosynthesis